MKPACTRSRVSRLAVATAVLLGTTFAAARVASADEAACVDASEASLGLRKAGKLHEALEQLAVCAAPACSTEVRQECAQRVEAINAAIPTVIFGAKDGAGNDLSAVSVTMDGAPLAAALDGRPMSFDPGPHTFRFETAGAPAVEKHLVLREGERDRQETVILGAVPLPSSAPPPFWTSRRVIALSGAAVGVAGIAVGAVLGGYALAAKNDEAADCSLSSCKMPRQANEDYTTAGHNATGSTVAFIVGGALVAGGAVLWFTAPRSSPAASSTSARLGLSPWFAAGNAGLTLTGSL
jgi:hypothetical protein